MICFSASKSEMSTSFRIFILLFIVCAVNVVDAQSNYLAYVLSRLHIFRHVPESHRLANLTDSPSMNSFREMVDSLRRGLNGTLLKPTFTLSDAAFDISVQCRQDLEIWMNGLNQSQDWAYQS